jgi:hypothetical protein
LYARAEDEKREGESFSDALEPTVGGYCQVDFAEGVEAASDLWDTEALEAGFKGDHKGYRDTIDEEFP